MFRRGSRLIGLYKKNFSRAFLWIMSKLSYLGEVSDSKQVDSLEDLMDKPKDAQMDVHNYMVEKTLTHN